MNIFDVHYKRLCDRMDEIVYFINTLKLQKKVLAEIESNKNDFLNSKKIIEYSDNLYFLQNSSVQYSAVIISIYGCYENFINDVATTYINTIFDITGTRNLNDSLSQKHIDNSALFLANPQRFRNYDLTMEVVSENLSKCIKKDKKAKLTVPLITSHSGSLNSQQTFSFFNSIGVKNFGTLMKSSEKFIDFMQNKYNLSRTDVIAYLKSDKNIFGMLDNLVEQRNNVAHSWCEENRIAYKDIQREIIETLKIFCECTCDLLIKEYFDVLFGNNMLKKYNKAIAIYDDCILCINSKKSRIAVGDYIFIRDKHNKYTDVARICEIQVKSNSIMKVEGDNIDIGIKLDKPIKNSYKFYWKK